MEDPSRSAVVVANGTLPRAEIIERELSAAQLVIAADGGANQLLERGIVPDAVLGDFDSLSGDLPSSIQVIPAPDQNFTDLEKAVLYLQAEGYDSITLLGATGDRLDHTFGALGVVCKYNVRLVDDCGVAVSVQGPGQLGIATTIGQIISLMPLGPVSGLTTLNLQWNLSVADFNFAERDGTSNVATGDFVEVFLRSGLLVVYAHHATLAADRL